MNFNFRIKNLELRNSEGSWAAEIVSWQSSGDKDYCLAIAYWVKGQEDYELRFVGNRPFKENNNDFYRLASCGQKILDDQFETEEHE